MIGLTTEKLHKFDYLSEPEVKDSWYRPENKEFLPLRNAINCIGGFISERPIYHPYKVETSAALKISISVDEFKISPAMKILTRALDVRYGGVDWDCKIMHTDQQPYFHIWIDTKDGSKSKSLTKLIEESNRVAHNIMFAIDNVNLINGFESTWEKLSDDSYWGYDYGHVNSEMFELISKAQNRKIKLKDLLEDEN